MIVDIFDKLYTNIRNENAFLTKIKYYALLRWIIRGIANLLIPLYYTVFRDLQNARLVKGRPEKKIIVSLTTFPQRIERVWLVIESILRQTYKPHSCILWLSKEQFPSFEMLPPRLLQQRERGLEIRLCDDDLKSHKKYYYALSEFSEDYIITLDDDIFYPSNLIGKLVEFNTKYPGAICCNRACAVTRNEDVLLPYIHWKEIIEPTEPSFDVFLTSGGGALFPPHSLHHEVSNLDVIKNCCMYADDVWLNIMSRLNLTKIVKTDYHSSLLPIIFSNNFNLNSLNVIQGRNDAQIAEVRDHFIKTLGVDAFSDNQGVYAYFK